jgi:hypothetical protein
MTAKFQEVYVPNVNNFSYVTDKAYNNDQIF